MTLLTTLKLRAHVGKEHAARLGEALSKLVILIKQVRSANRYSRIGVNAYSTWKFTSA